MGMQGIGSSLNVAFDLYNTADAANNDSAITGISDSNSSHIQINTNGAFNNQTEKAFRLSTNRASGLASKQVAGSGNVYVWVDYNGVDKLEVRVGKNGVRPALPVMTYTNITPEKLKNILGGDYGYVGFTGGSGANGINIDIKKFYFSNTYEPFDASRPKFTNPWHRNHAWASDYREKFAKINANIEHPGTGAITDRGFVYSSTSTNPTLGGNGVISAQSGSGIGSFMQQINGLTPGTRYYYAAYAINSDGTFYSGVNSFVASWLPTIGTTTVTNITSSSAEINSQVTAAGGINLTERGLVYSMTRTPYINKPGTTKLKFDNGAVGTFTTSVAGLAPGTTYNARSYAINNRGTVYGQEVSFTTLGMSMTNNTLLSYMIAQGGVLIPAFSKNLFAYNVTVPNSSSSVDMTFVPLEAAAALTLKPEDGITVTTLTPNKSFRISGLSASSPKYVQVKVAKGTEARIYTLNLTRQKSNNSDLADLRINSGAIIATPTFNTNNGIYTAVVDSSAASADVALRKVNSEATININGEELGDKGLENASQTLSLPAGSNSFVITVTAEDGKNSRTYYLYIQRKLSSDARLRNIAVSSGLTLSPTFGTDQLSYGVTVPGGTNNVLSYKAAASSGTGEVSITAAAIDINSSITMKKGNALIEDAEHVALTIGSNIITIEVTSAAGEMKAYNLNIIKDDASGSADNTLSDITADVSGGQNLIPAFDSSVKDYLLNVPAEQEKITMGGTASDSGASITAIQLNGVNYANGESIPLSPGNNAVTVAVTSRIRRCRHALGKGSST